MLVVALAACSEAPAEVEERVRAIKPYFVTDPAGGDVRRYSGTISSAKTSALSFAIAGTVATVEVNGGDTVTKGQLLATLDPEPMQLNLNGARSELAAAQAEHEAKKVDLDRQQQLFERGWVAKAALDQATAAFEAAAGQLNLARSRLGLAERDLEKTRLRAPFDGVIALREIEPFVEVKVGDTVLQLDSDGAFEVELSIPDTIVGRLAVGSPVSISSTTIAGCGCTGRITEIGSMSTAANAVPVKAAILQAPPGLLSGMAVEASLALSGNAESRGYMVPLVAIAPGDGTVQGFVFKYDQAEGIVRQTPISGDGPVSGNMLAVSSGVQAGDVLAAAGVGFLRDGQRVKLMGE